MVAVLSGSSFLPDFPESSALRLQTEEDKAGVLKGLTILALVELFSMERFRNSIGSQVFGIFDCLV